MKEIHTILAGNLKMYRAALKITQEQLADRCGISKNYIAEIETERKYPSPDVFMRLAKALGIDYWQLLARQHLYSKPDQELRLKDLQGAIVQDITAVINQHLANLTTKPGGKP